MTSLIRNDELLASFRLKVVISPATVFSEFSWIAETESRISTRAGKAKG
jgi:hypothetical protein